MNILFFSKVLWFFFQFFLNFFRKYVSRQPKLLKLRNSVDDGKLNEDTMAKKQKSPYYYEEEPTPL